MKRNVKRYITYIGLLFVLAMLVCGCRDAAEQEGNVADVTGHPGVTEPETERVEENKENSEEECKEEVTPELTSTPMPTSTPMSTSTPTPVITDPYDRKFWTGKYAADTELLLTKEQIKEQNEKNYRATGTKLVMLSECTGYTAGKVLEMIEEYSLPSRKYFDNKEFKETEKENLLQERNLSVLRENKAREIVPECGILIANTDVRSFPTKKRLTSEVQGRFDYLQETRLLIGEPVVVLHRSVDEEWCFVQAENYCGWVNAAAIAYCTRDVLCVVTEALAAVENNRIAVVTKSGNYRIGEQQVYLRMGTRLLCGDADVCDTKSGRTTEGQDVMQKPSDAQTGEIVTVRMPRKDTSGRLAWEAASVSSVDASGELCFASGYLPYTRANIVQLAVRLLGAPYAWGDAPSFGADVAEAGDNGMDCSSTVSAVFRCFGFVLPRNTGTQRKMDCEKQEMSTLGVGQRQAVLDSLQGGELLYTSGHVMLYLGKADGEYYVLHNTSTESRDDGGKDEFYRCVITTMGLGKKGQTILERLIQMNGLFPID